ncbi:MAG: FAD-dependent oxidoreductase [Candidatus Nanopelagicales bacterium]
MLVVVVGGGMAGLTVAALLSRTGSHEVTVLEHAPSFGTAGYGIGLYPLGACVFHALGAYGELARRSTVLSRYAVHGPAGELLQEVDLGGLLEDYGPMLGVSRTDLVDVLATCVPDGVIRFGVHAETVSRTDGGGVVVRSSEGGEFEADVVVAADGMHSAMRASVFGDVAPRETGFDAWMWWAPQGSTPAGTASEYWGPSAFVGLYPMQAGVNVAVGVPRSQSPDPRAGGEAVIEALRAEVTRRAPAAAALPGLWEIVDGRPFLWPMLDFRAPDITGLDDRVALVGDSGVGFLPTAGVGASNALRSAAALAYDLSLADAASAQLAVRRWRTRVRALVQANQEASRNLAKVMMVEHRSSSAVINAVMKHLPVTSMTKSIVASMEAPF